MPVSSKCARKAIVPDIVWQVEVEPYLDTAVCKALQKLLAISKLDATVIARAQDINHSAACISLYDSICVATAESMQSAVLLTGDKRLKQSVQIYKIQTHGVFWVFDRVREYGARPDAVLQEALHIWEKDPAVFLPPNEIRKRR